MFAVANNQFDPDAFKLRYGLTDSDFSSGLIGAQLFVVLRDGLVLPDDPPLFEPLPPATEPLLLALETQAIAAVAGITAYLAIADTATAAQVRAEVKAIDQRQRVIIQALGRLIVKAWR